jgi:hypothetical protein
MSDNAPPHSTTIIKRLLSGYQFSASDQHHAELAGAYAALCKSATYFTHYFALADMHLCDDEGVFFIEKPSSELSEDEKQTIVIIYLLVDLTLEQGRSPAELYNSPIGWEKLDWFRDGYGYEYLTQVKISDLDDIHEQWKSMKRRGIVEYHPDSRVVTLRRPAERIVNMARTFYLQQTREAPHE